MARILQIVLNTCTNDSRVLRAATVAQQMGHEITIYALHESTLPIREELAFGTLKRFILVTKAWSKARPIQLVKYAEAIFKMVSAGIKYRPDIVHANDLNALPIGYGIAKITGARLLYDSHELWSGANHLTSLPRWMVVIGLFMERLFAKKSDLVLTVCDGIAEEMKIKLGIPRPLVLRNIPQRHAESEASEAAGVMRKTLNISPDKPIILYQGVIAKGRGLEPLLEAAAQLQHLDFNIVVLGDGTGVAPLKSQVEGLQLQAKVFFHAAVTPQVLAAWTRDADIGVVTISIKNLCLSYSYALPNKFFEYIHAGLAVLVTDLVEMRRLVNTYEIGELLQEGTTSEIAAALQRLLTDKTALKRYKANSAKAAQILTWDVEKKNLEAAYNQLLIGSPAMLKQAVT